MWVVAFVVILLWIGFRELNRVSAKHLLLAAVHEAGHSVAAQTLPAVRTITKVSIKRTRDHSGCCEVLVEKDKQHSMDFLVFTMGGFAAERLYFKQIHPQSIIHDAKIAVDLGIGLQYSEKKIPDRVDSYVEQILGRRITTTEPLVKERALRVLTAAFDDATMRIKSNHKLFNAVSKALIKNTELNQKQFKKIVRRNSNGSKKESSKEAG